MNTLKLINNKTGDFTIVEVNKTVEKWLWENYYRLNYDKVEQLTNMGLA